MTTGKMAERQFSLPGFTPATFTKTADQASGALLSYATSGEVIPTVVIVFQYEQEVRLKYTLSNVIVSERTIPVHSGAGIIESGSLSYSKMSETHTPIKAAGKSQSPFTAGYDLEQASKL